MFLREINVASEVTFALLGFSYILELTVPLFLIFLAIYSFSVLGNLGMILITKINPILHTTMYLFLSHLSFADFCSSSIIVPKMTISFSGYMGQFFFFCTFIVTELILFAVMAYDFFMAVCSPLLYIVVMSQKLCVVLVFGPYIWGVVCSLTLTCSTLNFNTISHFCVQVLRFTVATFNEISTLLIILISYLFIIVTAQKMHSASGPRNIFSTRVSHLTTITIFLVTILFFYRLPKSKNSRNTVKVVSVFYTVIIRMLNPLIHSLGTKDVKDTASKMMDIKCIPQ
uniref:Olfactory receptor family 5 subfamily D member 16 n=1 Tax=Nannospalax galili TaxID=1026970 RepID=A0A8C6R9K1_NANGA